MIILPRFFLFIFLGCFCVSLSMPAYAVHGVRTPSTVSDNDDDDISEIDEDEGQNADEDNEDEDEDEKNIDTDLADEDDFMKTYRYNFRNTDEDDEDQTEEENTRGHHDKKIPGVREEGDATFIDKKTVKEHHQKLVKDLEKSESFIKKHKEEIKALQVANKGIEKALSTVKKRTQIESLREASQQNSKKIDKLKHEINKLEQKIPLLKKNIKELDRIKPYLPDDFFNTHPTSATVTAPVAAHTPSLPIAPHIASITPAPSTPHAETLGKYSLDPRANNQIGAAIGKLRNWYLSDYFPFTIEPQIHYQKGRSQANPVTFDMDPKDVSLSRNKKISLSTITAAFFCENSENANTWVKFSTVIRNIMGNHEIMLVTCPCRDFLSFLCQKTACQSGLCGREPGIGVACALCRANKNLDIETRACQRDYKDALGNTQSSASSSSRAVPPYRPYGNPYGYNNFGGWSNR
ncbi:MAG: hypothetical protein WCG05_00620 [Alphaproteobacteria bacterium]